MSENKTINVAQILMDEENPRHDIINGQREILNWHVENLGGKLITLMRSIAENGLSEIEKILITSAKEANDYFIVKEGNRRMAAVKLLHNPSLCDDPLFRRRIESVSVTDKLSFEIECVCCEDRQRVLWMMGLRHLGQQGGVGTYTWGAAEKGRHDLNITGSARYWRSLEFIEYALNNKLITDQQAARLYDKITNLDRLVPSAEFKQALGVTYKDRTITKSLPKHIYDLMLANILEEFSQPNFKVKSVYSSADKIDIISRAIEKTREQLEDAKTEDHSSHETSHTSENHSVEPEKPAEVRETKNPLPSDVSVLNSLTPKIRRQPDPSARDKLFIGKLGIPSNESKCNRLYNEIDSLKLSEHGLVIACSARALVEISCRIYIEKFNIECETKKNRFGQITFPDMIKICADDLHVKSKLSKELKNTITSGEATNPNSFASPQSLHNYLHGRYQNSMSALKAAWDSCYEELLRALWLTIHEAQQ